MRNYLVFALAFLSGGVFAAAPEDTNVGLGEVGLPVYGATSATSGYSQPGVAYPISAACAPVLPAGHRDVHEGHAGFLDARRVDGRAHALGAEAGR